MCQTDNIRLRDELAKLKKKEENLRNKFNSTVDKQIVMFGKNLSEILGTEFVAPKSESSSEGGLRFDEFFYSLLSQAREAISAQTANQTMKMNNSLMTDKDLVDDSMESGPNFFESKPQRPVLKENKLQPKFIRK